MNLIYPRFVEQAILIREEIVFIAITTNIEISTALFFAPYLLHKIIAISKYIGKMILVAPANEIRFDTTTFNLKVSNLKKYCNISKLQIWYF